MIKDDTIYPTGTCFDDCATFIARSYESKLGYKLVHGICLLENGKLYAHAWIELPSHDEAMGFGLAIINDKEEKVIYTASISDFYDRFKVYETTKYDYFEAMDNFINKKTHGPWEEKYLKLCNDYS